MEGNNNENGGNINNNNENEKDNNVILDEKKKEEIKNEENKNKEIQNEDNRKNEQIKNENNKIIEEIKNKDNKNIEEEKKENKKMKFQDLFNVINKQKIELEKLITEKSKDMREKYHFALSYSNGILIIIKLFITLLFERIENSFKENNNYFQFFKNIQTIYQSLSEQINNTKSSFKTNNLKSPKIYDSGLGTVLEKTQNSISKNFKDLSNSLQNKILSKSTTNTINDKYNEIIKLKKTINSRIDKIERRRKKLQKKYTSKYEILFRTFSPEINSSKILEKPSNLDDIEDFVIIIMDFYNATNKLVLKTNLFVIDMKDLLYKVNMLFLEYTNLIKTCALIYIKESKMTFSQEIVKDLELIEKYYEDMLKPGVDQSFRIPKIFDTEESKEKMNNNLKEYKIFLKNSNRVQNEILNSEYKFKIENYVNVELFFETLVSINPQPSSLNFHDLILDKFEIKRDPGMFSSWKDCTVMFTKQNHMIIFDKPINKFFVNIFEISHVTYTKREDKKKLFLFSITVNRKSKIMNTSGTFYYDALSSEVLKKIENYFNVIEGNIKGDIKK